jgi:hypothetical protein
MAVVELADALRGEPTKELRWSPRIYCRWFNACGSAAGWAASSVSEGWVCRR